MAIPLNVLSWRNLSSATFGTNPLLPGGRIRKKGELPPRSIIIGADPFAHQDTGTGPDRECSLTIAATRGVNSDGTTIVALMNITALADDEKSRLPVEWMPSAR
jgi:hypothetical protein